MQVTIPNLAGKFTEIVEVRDRDFATLELDRDFLRFFAQFRDCLSFDVKRSNLSTAILINTEDAVLATALPEIQVAFKSIFAFNILSARKVWSFLSRMREFFSRQHNWVGYIEFYLALI